MGYNLNIAKTLRSVKALTLKYSVIMLSFLKGGGKECWYCTGPHTVLDCGNDCTGFIPLFVEPLCVKSQHWWSCFRRVDVLVFPLWWLTVNKLTVCDLTLSLTAPFFKDIFSDINSSCLFYLNYPLNNVCCSVNFLWNKIIHNLQKRGFTFNRVNSNHSYY